MGWGLVWRRTWLVGGLFGLQEFVHGTADVVNWSRFCTLENSTTGTIPASFREFGFQGCDSISRRLQTSCHHRHHCRPFEGDRRGSDASFRLHSFFSEDGGVRYLLSLRVKFGLSSVFVVGLVECRVNICETCGLGREGRIQCFL